MYCMRCGLDLPEGAAFCPRCGAPAPVAAAADPPQLVESGGGGMGAVGDVVTPASGQPMGSAQRPVVVVPLVSPYAGFWRRFVAFVIDGLILTFVTFPINLALHIPVWSWMNQDEINFEDILALISASLVAIMIYTLITWLYSALFESSRYQATLGKLALNIQVTDLDGRRISFARATGRFAGKIVSKLLLMIGYLIQPLTQRRQALHDLMAGTLVVRRSAPL